MWSKHGFRTTPARSELMSKIKSKNTSPELEFKSLLRQAKIRFTTINKNLPGSPDFVLKLYPIAVFIDGEFWHGYKWNEKKSRIKKNRRYWIKKIESNLRRDRRTRKNLKAGNWVVIRFWSRQIKKNPKECLKRLSDAMKMIKDE
jgi:DNA mismatch endonuclease, patch repair protein